MFDNETLLFKYNIDTEGNPISIKVDKEQKQVSINGTIQMEFIPDEFNRINMLGENNQQMYEVFNRDEVTTNTYYVDYSSGTIYYDKSQFGKVKVYNYYSRGFQMIGASRIYDEKSINGELIVKTLQDIIDEGRKCLELIESLGDAVLIINKLDQDIKTGTVLHENLSNDIEIGIPLQANLRKDIDEANTFMEQLNQDVATGVIIKDELRQNTIDAVNANADLIASNNLASSNINLITKAGNYVSSISPSDWVESDGIFTYNLVHNLNTKSITINILAEDDEFSMPNGRCIDNDTVLIRSDSRKSIKVILNASYYSGGIDSKLELMEARKGKDTLKDKIDDIDISLEQIKSNDDDKGVNIKKYGAKGDGITDNYDIIKNLLNTYDTVIIPRGNFLVSNTIIVPSGKTLKGTNIKTSKLFLHENCTSALLKTDTSPSSYCTIKDLSLYHKGTISSEATLLIDDVTGEVADEHHLIENIFIENPPYIGMEVKSQIREIRVNNVVIRGVAEKYCFKISSTDSTYNELTAIGGKENGFLINGGNNKFVNCKAFYCGNNYSVNDNVGDGFLIQGNKNSFTNCESQENSRNGFSLIDAYFNNLNIVSDTNGRNKTKGGVGLYLKNSNNNIIIGQINSHSSLNGKHVSSLRVDDNCIDNNINISVKSDTNSKLIDCFEKPNLLGNNLIINGKQLNQQINKFDRTPNTTNRYLYDAFKTFQWTGTTGTNSSYIDLLNQEQVIKGSVSGQWQGIKIVNTNSLLGQGKTKIKVLLYGYCVSGAFEMKILFYNNDNLNLGTSQKSNVILEGSPQDSYVYLDVNIPSGATYCNVEISCYNNGVTTNFESHIKDLQVAIY